MKAKKVFENLEFKRGIDSKKALNIGMTRKIVDIKKAIKSAAESLYIPIISLSDKLEDFSMGFDFKDNILFIGINDNEFIAGVKGEGTEYFNTIEEAQEWIMDQVEYIEDEDNDESSGECSVCGEWLDDANDECPNCEGEED